MSLITSAECENYISALRPEYTGHLDELFRGELEVGRISKQHRKPVRMGSIGAVSKKNGITARPITDYSRPGCSLIHLFLLVTICLKAWMMPYRKGQKDPFLLLLASDQHIVGCLFIHPTDSFKVFEGGLRRSR